MIAVSLLNSEFRILNSSFQYLPNEFE